MSDDHGTDGPGVGVGAGPGQQPRGLAALAYSGQVVVGLAAVTLAGVAGAADAAPQNGAGTLTPLTRTAGDGSPAHSSRTASRKLARRLIKDTELPPGPAQLHFAKLPKVLRDLGDGPESFHKVDIFKVLWDRRDFENAFGYVNRHHPDGWQWDGSGSAYAKAHGKKIFSEKFVTYAPRQLPAADNDIEMQISVVPRQGHSWIRVDLMVIWYPRRSAAEHLIASHFRSVTATAWQSNQKPHYKSRTFKQRAIIDRLSKVLNSLPASPGGIVNCPLIDTTYRLTFHPIRHQGKVVIDLNGCFSLGIEVGGHYQPALVDNGRVEQVIIGLLRIHPAGLVVSPRPKH
jgi:hypothetical protein